MHSKCLVCLGPENAILNALPLASHFNAGGTMPFLVVHSEHQHVLDGIDYVQHIGVPASTTHAEAMAWANATFKDVIACPSQQNDPNAFKSKDSWDKESWGVAGHWPHFQAFPMVLPRRESRSSFSKLNKTVIVDVPQPVYDALIKGPLNVFNLEWNREIPPVELATLFDQADLLVTADRPSLQVARATKIPIIYVRENPDPWRNSCPPCNQLFTLYQPTPETVAEAVGGVLSDKWPATDVKLVHSCAIYPMKGDNLRRHEVARASWEEEYKTGKWINAWLHERDLKRTSRQVGDKRGVHFCKDIINFAAHRCRTDDDLIVLTNGDNSLVPGITERLIYAASRTPVYSHRHDFPRLDRTLTREEALTGDYYPGWDFFSFTRRWWLAHGNEMPDSLISYSSWDFCLSVLCRKYGGEDFGCAVTHEAHSSFWAQPEVRQRHPGEKYNQKVNRPYLRANGVTEADCRLCA